ncbi:glutathione peroxidase [Timonella senegalensis]|uniref:glutathione peroxidase n=1 Tax=Timonella senegalensis TaxID=1465825 RepID=UPI0028AD3BF8|nr:glutathione peroxidase [Timonella senegalensis]
MADLNSIELTLIDGTHTTFGQWDDQVKLVVNVASKCGFTPQYEALEAVYEKYRDQGFVVLGLPSNQFLQETGSAEKIAEYCSLTWGVTFPMMQKVRVNGSKKHPLYAELRHASDASGYSGRIRWNFEKFLVGKDGSIQRFAPATTPDSPEVIAAIEAELAKS